MGDPDRISGSWLQPDPVLHITAIRGMKTVEAQSLFPFVSVFSITLL